MKRRRQSTDGSRIKAQLLLETFRCLLYGFFRESEKDGGKLSLEGEKDNYLSLFVSSFFLSLFDSSLGEYGTSESCRPRSEKETSVFFRSLLFPWGRRGKRMPVYERRMLKRSKAQTSAFCPLLFDTSSSSSNSFQPVVLSSLLQIPFLLFFRVRPSPC